jgi:hypothetical protein
LECWCSAAEAVPDRRLLDVLEGDLHRELYAVDDTYSTLCAVLDVERPRLKEARKRAEQQDDQVLNKSLDELTVEDVMDKPAKMELRCESCGETNQFEMPGIFISLKHPKDGFCIGGGYYLSLLWFLWSIRARQNGHFGRHGRAFEVDHGGQFTCGNRKVLQNVDRAIAE